MNKKRYRHLTYNAFIVKVARWFVVPCLRWFFRISARGLKSLAVKPPYIVLAQHASVWDPLVYNAYIKVPLHFVVSDSQFRVPFMRRVLGLVGSIAKKKSAIDMNAVLEIMHVLKARKEALCIFPEGVNTWDGCSFEMVESTAKLIKRMQIPVICARSHGAYLSRPRWGRGARRGMWRVHYELSLTPQRIKSLSEEAILEYVKKGLYNDEYENQRINKTSFISSQSAEYIERVLFACPYCETVQSLVSEQTCFSCRVCCNMWRFRSDGFIQRRRHGPLAQRNLSDVEMHITTVAQWNAWQQGFLEHLLEQQWAGQASAIFYDEDVRLFWGEKRLVYGGICGACELTHDEFVFTPYGGGRRGLEKSVLRIEISDMKSSNVQNNEKFEWTSSRGLTYELSSKNPRVNMYKYMCALKLLQNKRV